MKRKIVNTRSKPEEAGQGPSGKDQSQERTRSPLTDPKPRRSKRLAGVSVAEDRLKDDPLEAEVEEQMKILDVAMDELVALLAKREEAHDSLCNLTGGIEVERKRQALARSFKKDKEDEHLPDSEISHETKMLLDEFEQAQTDAYIDLQAHAQVLSAIDLKIRNLRQEAGNAEDRIRELTVLPIPPFRKVE